MKQCDNGHFYDEARFESCPYCKENTGIGKTMAAADIGKTVAAFPGNPAAAAATAFDSGKTVAVMKKKIGILIQSWEVARQRILLSMHMKLRRLFYTKQLRIYPCLKLGAILVLM